MADFHCPYCGRLVYNHELTNRELGILRLIGSGHTNKEIARLSRISDQTVKNHVTTIFSKLGVRDRTQAVVLALKTSLFTLDDLDQPGTAG